MSFIESALPGTLAWIQYFERASLPVLSRTTSAIAEMRENIDDLAPRDISAVVVEDPLMSLKVLVWAGKHLAQNIRTSRSNLSNEIETVEEALVSTGTAPFFRQFDNLETVESRLADLPDAQRGLQQVLDRSLAAADFAREWASYRNDIDIQVITEAAMLHDVAEMLVWAFAPKLSLKMAALHRASPHTRTRDIQKIVLGTTFNQLEVAIMQEWRLSKLLKRLTDDAHAQSPQVRNVLLAANLARHLANSHDDPALPDDFRDIGQLLNISPQRVREMVFTVDTDDSPPTANGQN